MWAGTRRLVLLGVVSPAKAVLRTLSTQQKLALSHSPHRDAAELFEDCVTCAADKLITDAGGPAWTPGDFRRVRDHVRAELFDTTEAVVARVEAALAIWQRARATLGAMKDPADTLDEIAEHLGTLVHPGFVTDTGYSRLPDLQRYLRAVERRLEKLPDDPYRDHGLMLKLDELWTAYEATLDRLPPERRTEDAVTGLRWMLEELRVSYFAQTLGTPYPVSDKRFRRALDKLTEPVQ
jgi:ATP-dependent helicase HrpA